MLNQIPASLQSLTTYGDVTTAPKQRKDEDYFQLKRDYENLLSATNSIITAVNNGEFALQVGTGSPEGVVTANYSAQYIDTDTSQVYRNDTYGANTGWIAL